MEGFSQGIGVGLINVVPEADDDDTVQVVVLVQIFADFPKGDSTRPFDGEPVDPRAHGREGDAPDPVFTGQSQAALIAPREKLVLAVCPSALDGADGVDDPSCGEPIPFLDPGFPNGTTVQFPAFLEQFGASGSVNGTIHTTPPPRSDEFAAFTTASTSWTVIPPRTMESFSTIF